MRFHHQSLKMTVFGDLYLEYIVRKKMKKK